MISSELKIEVDMLTALIIIGAIWLVAAPSALFIWMSVYSRRMEAELEEVLYRVWNQYGPVSPVSTYTEAVEFRRRSNAGIPEKFHILSIEPVTREQDISQLEEVLNTEAKELISS